MNHVPNDIVDALDKYGESLLAGTPQRVSGQLRADLRIRIDPPDGERALCRYETEHTQAPETLRDRGSFVATVVDSVDDRLESWGIVPPDAYEYTETVDGTHRYEGTLRLTAASR
jgi:hypothetical protein